MNCRHLAILGIWSLMVMVVVGILMLPLMGNCAGNEVCERNDNRYFWTIVGSAFLIYWTVFIVLVRRWNR